MRRASLVLLLFASCSGPGTQARQAEEFAAPAAEDPEALRSFEEKLHRPPAWMELTGPVGNPRISMPVEFSPKPPDYGLYANPIR